jgi:primosomal protein N''
MSKKRIEWEKDKEFLMEKIKQLETRLVDHEDREKRLKDSQNYLMSTLSNINTGDESRRIQDLIKDLTDEVRQMKCGASQEFISSMMDRVSRVDRRFQNK